MPIFQRKSLTKARSRDVTLNEGIEDFKNISINLINDEITFKNGVWEKKNSGRVSKDVNSANYHHKLEDQNRMLNAKIEILLDMIAESHAK